MPKEEDEHLRDEYHVTPVSIVCHSMDRGYYFVDYQHSQSNHAISYMICLVQKSSVDRLYCSPEVILRLSIAKVPVWNHVGNFTHLQKFVNDFVLTRIRDEYLCSEVFYETHPSTNNGTRQVIDLYCLRDGLRFVIDLNQEDVFYSTLKVEKIPSLLESYFCNWNTIVPEPLLFHRPNMDEMNKICMIVLNEDDTTLMPMILREGEEGSDFLKKDIVKIQPIPLNSMNHPLFWTILTRLDCVDDNVIIYNYLDMNDRKYHHIIRKLSIQQNENHAFSGKLTKSLFGNFFKHFTEKFVVSGSCRLSDYSFLFLLCSIDSYFDMKFDSWDEFVQNSKWIIVDLKHSTIKHVEPYSGKLLESNPSRKKKTIQNKDGFALVEKKKHVTLRKTCDSVNIRGANFCAVSLISYQPSKCNQELVNVICTVPVQEFRTSYSQKKQESINTVLQMHYCFKLQPKNFFMIIPKQYEDVRFKLQ